MSNITRIEETDSGVEIEYDVEILDEDTNLVPAVMVLKCTFEGVIIDISDPETGEIIRTGYQLVDDLIEKAH